VSEQKQDERVGALWSKESARGPFFTGNLELKPEQIAKLQANGGKLQIVVFGNDRKTGNQPDWRILESKPKDAMTAPVSGHNLNAPVNDSDIPF
jgi:hypothetical protein